VATAYMVQAQTPATTVVRTQAYISNKVIATNLATITTNAVHGITQVGTPVYIQGVDAIHDGWHTVHSVPSTTTFTYVSTTATQGTTAVSPVGVATFVPVTAGFVVSNKVCQNYVATLTSAAHGLAVGDWVAVNIGDAIYDTVQAQVIAVPSTTTFCYLVTTSTGATTAVTQGSFSKTSFSGTYQPTATKMGVSSSVYVCNTGYRTEYFRIAVRKSGTALANQFAAFDVPIPAGGYVVWTTGLSLATAEIVNMSASSQLVIFTIDGSEI
jgi:hypothetical protein